MSNKLLDAALAYRRAGLSVFPCEPPTFGDKESGKKPLCKWQQYQHTLPSEEQIREWWSQWPDANIGLVCGRLNGVAVLDVDPRNGGKREGMPPTDMVVASGDTGGVHLYYQHPGTKVDPLNRKTAKHAELQGIDTKGDGSYVIAPPSNHWTGTQYKWEKQGTPGVWKDPSGFVPHENNGQIVDPGAQWIASLLVHGLEDGSRNVTMTRLAGYFAGKGIAMDIAEVLMLQLNARSPVPTDAAEVVTTVRSVYKTERQNAKNAKAQEKNRVEQHTLDLIPFSQYMPQFEGSHMEWIIRGWVPSKEVGMLVSEPEGYKTWLCDDLAISIASGTNFLGQFEVDQPGPVITLNLEDSHSDTVKRMTCIMQSRFHAFLEVAEDTETHEQEFEVLSPPSNLPIYFHPSSTFQLTTDKAMDALEEQIATIKPRALIIDPLYQLVGSLDDYMTSAVKRLRPLKEWREKYKLTTIIAHHRKKATKENDPFSRTDAWGSQLINAFLGFGFQIARTQPDRKTISLMRHFKNAAPGRILNLAFMIETESTPWVYDVTLSDYQGPKDGGKDLTQSVMRMLQNSLRALTPAEIAQSLGETEVQIRTVLTELLRSDLIVSDALDRGGYRAANLATNPEPQVVDPSQDKIDLEKEEP